jgi:hypothetical protein
MTSKEKALKICQEFGRTTLFAKDCNEGYTLPLRISKLCGHIAVDEILNELIPADFKDGQTYMNLKAYWREVKAEIEKL